jgi:hypothetical protein
MEGRKMAAVRHLKVVGPANVKRTVALPVRKPNAAYRSREMINCTILSVLVPGTQRR